MMSSLKWFGPKRVGWGIRPTHLMGWIVLFVCIVGFSIGLQLITTGASVLSGFIVSGIFILLLIIITSLSYDKSSRRASED